MVFLPVVSGVLGEPFLFFGSPRLDGVLVLAVVAAESKASVVVTREFLSARADNVDVWRIHSSETLLDGAEDGRMFLVVLGSCEQLQVGDVVVSGISIDVMDLHPIGDWSVVVFPHVSVEGAVLRSAEIGSVPEILVARISVVDKAVPLKGFSDSLFLRHVRSIS